MENIGIKLNKLRVEKGLSLRELGKEVSLSHSYIDAIEKGVNARPGPAIKFDRMYGLGAGINETYYI